jgi:putative membrane protein
VSLAHLLSRWSLDPGLLVVLCALAAAYLLGAARASRWPPIRTASFLSGLVVLALALMSGIDRYADELLSIHVAQHLLLILLAPALLLWGAPVALVLQAARKRATRQAIGATLHRRWVRLVVHPAFGFAVFTAVVLCAHLTGLYELALRDPLLHYGEHAAYLWSGLLLLVSLVGSNPIPIRLGGMARFTWLMAAMTVMAVPAGLFLFAGHPLYRAYVAPALELHRSALADQRAAGVVMLLGGGLLMGTLAAAIAMRAMVAEERRQRRRDEYAAVISAAPQSGGAAPSEQVGGGVRV